MALPAGYGAAQGPESLGHRRSSRTLITECHSDKVMAFVKPGDFVMMQFGLNDGGPVNDNSRARSSLKAAAAVR